MILTAALLMLTGPALVYDPDTEPRANVKAREVKLDKAIASAPGPTSRFDRPTRITSKKQLKDIIGHAPTLKTIDKEVDFSNEAVLLFSWHGSSRDTVSFEQGKKEVVFTRTLGRTRDLKHFIKVFVVPKGTKYTTVNK